MVTKAERRKHEKPNTKSQSRAERSIINFPCGFVFSFLGFVMTYDFDTVIDRKSTSSAKWNWYPPDVLPLWVADMDFPSPDAVADAIRTRADHNVYGYQMDLPSLRSLLVERLAQRHALTIAPEHILFIPGLVVALNLICRTLVEAGAGVIVQPPVYPPFLTAPTNSGRVTIPVSLTPIHEGTRLRYAIDFEALHAAVTPNTQAFIFCNPHNPIGHVYTRAELEQVAAFVIEHDLLLISDEIHCDLVFAPHQHISIASLSPAIAARTITLLAPSKTFNTPGLACASIIVSDDDRRTRLSNGMFANGMIVNNIGFVAADAAYRHGQAWLDQVMAYLSENLDLLTTYVQGNFPQATITAVAGTYLAWIDFSAYQLEGGAYKFFLEQAKVALNDGATFGGTDYADCVRLNFACTRKTLWEALRRMSAAVNQPKD